MEWNTEHMEPMRNIRERVSLYIAGDEESVPLVPNVPTDISIFIGEDLYGLKRDVLFFVFIFLEHGTSGTTGTTL